MKVYLAGPMCGCDSNETYDWRDEVANALADVDIEVYDPSVGLDYIFEEDDRLLPCNDHHGVTNKEVFQKDIFMIDQCDILLVDLYYQNPMSTGCYFEMGYAFAKGKPIIVANAGVKKNHPFIDIPAFNVDTVEDAVEYIKGLSFRKIG